MSISFIKSDCLDYIKKCDDNSIDLIYFDPPFATTHNAWDKPLNWKELFPLMFKKIKDHGAIIIHCAIPFTYELIQHKKPKYHYIWVKEKATNFFHAKNQPLRKQEEVLVYYKKQPTYNPQMIGDEWIPETRSGKTQYYHSTVSRDRIKQFNGVKEGAGHYGKYPTNVLEMPRKLRNNYATRGNKIIDFFIKTYSNKGDIVLDLTCHSGVVGKRCKLLKRNYVGVDIEMHPYWFTS